MVPVPADDLARARDSYARRDWTTAYHSFRAAEQRTALGAEDLALLSEAAWWLGHVDECVAAGEQAYRALTSAGNRRDAAMVALGLALTLAARGDDEAGFGWVERCQGLLRAEPVGPEHGYLLFVTRIQAQLDTIRRWNAAAVSDVVDAGRRVQRMGHDEGDPALVALGLLGEGRALVKAGRAPDGMTILDRVAASLRTDDIAPEWAGELHCQLMAAAAEVVDLRRLRHLSTLTTNWLENMPAAVLFTGICRLHRSQLFQATGEWDRALQDATASAREMANVAPTIAAGAEYQIGEILRLRGNTSAAEEAYRRAHRLGRDPQPGLALLRLATGNVRAATRSVAAALVVETADPLARMRLYAAQVETALAAGDVELAAASCVELEDAARAYDTDGLHAMARHARGHWLLATGRTDDALAVLRDACQRWHEADAPYECARVRLLLARAYQLFGDSEAATLELEAAAGTFTQLGAIPDLRTVSQARGRRPLPGRLTAREAEVLAHVARGDGNRAVAAALLISEKTVARHLSNIFTKLGVSSRTAAATYAVEHGLVADQDG